MIEQMALFIYAKLVRDRIWQLELDAGHTPKGKHLRGLALKRALLTKLTEEATEIPVAKTATKEVIEELADVQQVLDDLAHEYGITKAQIGRARRAKLAKKGGFRAGIYIDTVEITDETDPFLIKFRADPAKYPEV